MVLFKKQAGSAFPVSPILSAVIVWSFFFLSSLFPSSVPLRQDYFFSHFRKLTAAPRLHIEMSNCSAGRRQTTALPARCAPFHFTALALAVLLFFQAWLIVIWPLLTGLISLADHIAAGYRKFNFFLFYSQNQDRFWVDSWRLFSRPEIKLSATVPVPHCWREHPDPNEVCIKRYKGTRVRLFPSYLSNASLPWNCIHKQMSAGRAWQIMTKD